LKGLLIDVVYKKYTHTHRVQNLKLALSASVTSISENALVGVVQTKDNYKYIWDADSRH
jgi:hypothetical protein